MTTGAGNFAVLDKALKQAGFSLQASTPWVGPPTRTDVRVSHEQSLLRSAGSAEQGQRTKTDVQVSPEPVSFGEQEASRGGSGETKSKEKQEADRAAQEINEAVSKLDAAIAAAGGSAELTKHLSNQRDHLVALKSQLALGFRSGAGLTELLQQVHAAASTATQTAATVIAGGSIGGVSAHIATAEYQRAAAESRNWLHSTAEQFEKDTNTASAVAAKYGIDVSEHDKKIKEEKQREKDALAKGDIKGALDARGNALGSAIAKEDDIINNSTTSDADRKAAEARKKGFMKQREELKKKELKLEEKDLQQKVQEGKITEEDKKVALAKIEEKDAANTKNLQKESVYVVADNVDTITANEKLISAAKRRLKVANNNISSGDDMVSMTLATGNMNKALPTPKADVSVATADIKADISTQAKAAVGGIEKENKPTSAVASDGELNKKPTQLASTEAKASLAIG